MITTFPMGFSQPVLTYAMLSEQNPFYARHIGITEKDLNALKRICHALYERSFLLYQRFQNYKGLNPSAVNSVDPQWIHSGDRMILKGYNARYSQPILYTNAHIEGRFANKQPVSLSVCVEPNRIDIDLISNIERIKKVYFETENDTAKKISSSATGEYWVEVPVSQIQYCGVGKKLFSYQGENAHPSNHCHSNGHSCESGTGYPPTHQLLISGWVSVFEYENREKIF